MISKKDLLKQMNISYGQLYRWKREGLIPDEWFIKQSVSTGQETYFDENLIIPRIEKIIDLKDKYQIDQLKAFLSPNVRERIFNPREIILIDDIDPYVLKEYVIDKKELQIIDVAIIYIFSKHPELDFRQYRDYNYTENVTINSIFYIIKIAENNYILITSDKTVIDKRLEIVEMIKIDDIVSQIAKSI